jgi:branched-chain amino acid transport system substrate-binding protein
VVDDTITENWSTGATIGLTSEINKIKRARASCVVVWLTPQDSAAFVQQAKSLGDTFTILGNDEINADPTFSSLAGRAANGAIGATLTALLHPNAQLKAFSAAYQKAYGSPPTPFADTTYDSIMMLRKAITMAHSTDAEALRNAFNHIHGFVGTTGVLGFTPQNHTTIGINQLTMVKYNAAKQAWLPFPW